MRKHWYALRVFWYHVRMYDKSNIFAKILRNELKSEKEYENEHAIVIKDKFPKAPIHNLVLPKGEYIDMRDFCKNASDVEKLAFIEAIGAELNKFEGGAKVLINIEKDGGQVVFHLHAHIFGKLEQPSKFFNDMNPQE